MKGVVRSHEPIIQVPVLNSKGQSWLVNAVLDTGAVCHLTLPAGVIRKLGWIRKDQVSARLAGDLEVLAGVYEGQILWDGVTRTILVHEMEGQPLIGTKLLDGYRIVIDLIEGGAVDITPLNHNLEEQHDA